MARSPASDFFLFVFENVGNDLGSLPEALGEYADGDLNGTMWAAPIVDPKMCARKPEQWALAVVLWSSSGTPSNISDATVQAFRRFYHASILLVIRDQENSVFDAHVQKTAEEWDRRFGDVRILCL